MFYTFLTCISDEDKKKAAEQRKAKKASTATHPTTATPSSQNSDANSDFSDSTNNTAASTSTNDRARQPPRHRGYRPSEALPERQLSSTPMRELEDWYSFHDCLCSWVGVGVYCCRLCKCLCVDVFCCSFHRCMCEREILFTFHNSSCVKIGVSVCWCSFHSCLCGRWDVCHIFDGLFFTRTYLWDGCWCVCWFTVHIYTNGPGWCPIILS